MRLALASAVPLLELAGTVLGGYELVRAALCAQAMITRGEGDRAFLVGKIQTARFYATSVLPSAAAPGPVRSSRVPLPSSNLRTRRSEWA